MADSTVYDILKALKKLTPEQKQWLRETLATTPARENLESGAHDEKTEQAQESDDFSSTE